KGSLIVLLSQDRWVILRGLINDLKAVTSGEWLREATAFEGALTTFATMLVYIAPIFMANATSYGALFFLALMSLTTACIGLSNALANGITMKKCRIWVSKSQPRRFPRRLVMVDHLEKHYCTKETGKDWAFQMGLIRPEKSNDKHSMVGQVVM